ncbi:MAG: molybdopterin molybdotransferase MoeA [Bacteroidota bacterium]|nr:molybdopterin molybdotransferase MoeA [Bacteroidota bacterium]MDX5447859.1 molybdopterin molybdotransferase MoeA [Bacteroidota bacterium]MDX5505311.1 molybdopterin molybdotransferase MoeA [Bacteroidota bacterium]
MLSVEEALKIVEEQSPEPVTARMELSRSAGMILTEDIRSPIDMPPFRQSAMDGYALNLNGSPSYEVIGEVKAGDEFHPTLKPGQCVRIFTGAAVPDSANTVVMQEQVERLKDKIQLTKMPSPDQNIRPKGEQVKLGDIALPRGTRLSPAAVGFLASLGIPMIQVIKQPTIALVITGNELVDQGTPLKHGQIYESNGVMLSSALTEGGFPYPSILRTKDDLENTRDILNEAISSFDLVLVSGGISVGDYDFVGTALKDLGVETLFYKVNQKPGKPLFFGKKGSKRVFGLPGNPASALTCLYVYVFPLLSATCGGYPRPLARTKAKISQDLQIKGDRAQFLKAKLKDDQVDILKDQSSAMLNTFSHANALVYVSGTNQAIRSGEEVDVIQLPG